jgi:prepilin-type N-terminal cleavage/methylation domain-containing protein/prepilin-type processing-associated H-X9-DG protein
MRGPRKIRRGLTLVELLVVMAILGLLVGLLLPATQAAREASRRTKCASNLRQMGLGLLQFHDAHAALPPSGWTHAAPGNPSGKFVGWRALVLPYLEQASVQTRYDRTVHWWEGTNLELATTGLAVYECPSAAQRAEVRSAVAKPPRPAITFPLPLAPADYEAIMGVQPVVDPVRYATPATNRSATFRNSAINLAAILDGTSHTLLIVECTSRPLVFHRRRLQANEFNDQGQGWIDSEGAFSLDGSSGDGVLQALGPVRTPVAVNATNFNEPYSFHPGGTQGVYADGHVVLAPETISLLTYAALCTRDGNEVADSSSY